MDTYISCLEAAKVFEMSPGRFAQLLRKEREQLPLEINREAIKQSPYAMFAPKALQKFYDGEAGSEGFLWALKIHRLDWDAYLSGRREDEGGGAVTTRIAELEAELAACRAQLAERGQMNPSGCIGDEGAGSATPADKAEMKKRERDSYLTVIAALAHKSRSIDLTLPTATSTIEREVEGLGLKLGEKTIRRIIKETQTLMDEKR